MTSGQEPGPRSADRAAGLLRAVPYLLIVVVIAADIATLFGAIGQYSSLAAVAALPIAAWEFSLGVWLVVKGFKPCPITVASAPSPGGDPERELVSSIA